MTVNLCLDVTCGGVDLDLLVTLLWKQILVIFVDSRSSAAPLSFSVEQAVRVEEKDLSQLSKFWIPIGCKISRLREFSCF